MFNHSIKLLNSGILIGASILLYSCQNKVTITRDYIYSSNWETGEYQGFQIAKIELQDSTISVHNKNFNKYFLDKYIIDSNFCFLAGRNKLKKVPKMYFNIPSDNYSWFRCNDILQPLKTIGPLSTHSWYIITGLHGTEDFYVYIDKDGSSYTYGLGPTNW